MEMEKYMKLIIIALIFMVLAIILVSLGEIFDNGILSVSGIVAIFIAGVNTIVSINK